MKDTEIKAEFEQLKAQLEALQKAREQAQGTSEAQARVDDDQEVTDGEAQAQSPGPAEALMEQFQTLLGELEDDIQHTRPATLLTIFAMGVLVGRFLTR